ncbi:unnamed protein product [Gulo gulo]|uniref:Uncharacterized protein n=1 Tax=Gulo gulo TaxID=48420 RepID=A0A9X9PSS8_GULGU|nr:unnamed protein product [Gulo gulo]
MSSKRSRRDCSASEAVQGAALAFQCIHHVHGGDRLAFGVLRVSHRIADHVLQKDFQDSPGLLIDEPRNALDTTSAGEPADGGLRDALDVIPEDFPVPLSASFPQPFTAFPATRHLL